MLERTSERLRISQHTGEEARPRPRVVLLGDPKSAEFAEVFQLLDSVIPAAQLATILDFGGLAELTRRDQFPDFLVVVQTWSDEFRFEDFLKLSGFGPLTRVLCCFGPWCVSDGRSRQDWPLALRVPLEHFATTFRSEWQQIGASPSLTSPLAWTAGRDEIFRRRQPAIACGLSVNPSPTIQIVSADRDLADMWRELADRAGFTLAAGDRPADFVLWDADPLNSEHLARLDDFQQQLPDTKIVALMGFSTPDVAQTLRNHGVIAVISKLLPLDALLEKIQTLASAHSSAVL